VAPLDAVRCKGGAADKRRAGADDGRVVVARFYTAAAPFTFVPSSLVAAAFDSYALKLG
jgi:hypothetical protein